MKAILEFDLDNPEDLKAYNRTNKATDMAIVLFELIYNTNKNILNKETPLERHLECVFEEINRLCEEYNIVIDELIT